MFLILMTTSASHSRWLERHCPLSTVANPYTSVYLRKKSILMIESDEQHTYLSTTNENDGLTCDISHGECRSHLLKRNQKKGKKRKKNTKHKRGLKKESHLIIHRVPFRHQHPINTTSLTYDTRSRRIITQRTIKFGQLVDSLVAYKRLANENDLVGIVG